MFFKIHIAIILFYEIRPVDKMFKKILDFLKRAALQPIIPTFFRLQRSSFKLPFSLNTTIVAVIFVILH